MRASRLRASRMGETGECSRSDVWMETTSSVTGVTTQGRFASSAVTLITELNLYQDD